MFVHRPEDGCLQTADLSIWQCVAELRESAKLMCRTGITEAVDANAVVYMSDTAISAVIQEALKEAVASLENVQIRRMSGIRVPTAKPRSPPSVTLSAHPWTQQNTCRRDSTINDMRQVFWNRQAYT